MPPRHLHVPGKPVVFANIGDVPSLNTIASLNHGDNELVHAVATVSWALAAALGLQDEELTFEHNIEAIRRIAPFAYKAGSPAQRRSGYLQDGYGSRIEEVVTEAVKAGVSGANIEDSIPSIGLGKGIPGSLYGLEEQVQRLRAAIRVADAAGCPDLAPECPM